MSWPIDESSPQLSSLPCEVPDIEQGKKKNFFSTVPSRIPDP